MIFACFVFQSKFCSATVHISPGGFEFLDVTRIDKTSLKIFFKQKSPFSSGDISIDYNLTLLYTNFKGRFHT